MTHRRELEHHRHSLEEIGEIMNSMKTLSYMESRKLSRFIDAQQAVVRSIEEATSELLSFYPEIMPVSQTTMTVHILVGTERGFCGDFNHALLHQARQTMSSESEEHVELIGIGQKLHTLLEQNDISAMMISGASMAEEVSAVLSRITNQLTELQQQHGLLVVHCHYHSDEQTLTTRQLLPPFEKTVAETMPSALPPVLNLPPDKLLVELTEQYLFAALHEMLYTSLMVESTQRISHLEGAVQHLHEETDELIRQCNALRQEEIIEEIEVILLSSANITDTGIKYQRPESE